MRVPPGPDAGVLGLAFAQRLRQDPLGGLTDLASYGDIAHSRMGPYRLYLVNHPDLIQQVLATDRKKFRKEPRQIRVLGSVDGLGLVTSEGDLWARQRRLVQPAFHRDRLAHYADVIVTKTSTMVDGWRASEEIEVTTTMTELTLGIIVKTLFNLEVSGEAVRLGQAVRELSEVLVRELSRPLLLPDWLPLPEKRRKRRALAEVDGFIRDTIRARRESGADHGDLLSMLLTAVDDAEEGDGRGMSDRQARDEAITLFNAGHDSTAAALAWTWYLIGVHPDEQRRLQQEVDAELGDRDATFDDLPRLRRTEMVAREAMRLYPPTWALFFRKAVEDTQLGGYPIPKGSWIYLSPWATHRDARFFPDPLSFDPQRFAPDRAEEIPRHGYFPFGVGSHTCVGNHFAMMEIVLSLATVLRRATLSLPEGTVVEPEPLVAIRPRGQSRILLVHADSCSGAIPCPVAFPPWSVRWSPPACSGPTSARRRRSRRSPTKCCRTPRPAIG